MANKGEELIVVVRQLIEYHIEVIMIVHMIVEQQLIDLQAILMMILF